MASYFYLMSSLPMLKYEQDMPIKYEQFLSYCDRNVGENKYKILKNLSLDSDKGPLVKDWALFYKRFKDELTYQRSKKLGINTALPSDKDSESSKIIGSAIDEENPLVAENLLLSLQFETIDSLIGDHIFDDYALFGYALKLKVLERKTVFNQKKGKSELKRLIKGLEEQVESIN